MSTEVKDVPPGTGVATKVVVATSVMLSFISFWRAAAIVLNDLGSSAFYAGGIAEKAIGHSAPWFILGVMLFSIAVRAVYIESCAMFTRGGVYRVVKEAMGGTLAKISVSALMFDYILTGPISGVSAGQYVIGLTAQTLTYFGFPWDPSPDTINHLAAIIAILVTTYFWRRNVKGIHESSDDALKIMYVTSVMVVLLIAWCSFTIFTQPAKQRLPPSPTPHNLSFDRTAVGWLPDVAPGALQTDPSAPRANDQQTDNERFTLTSNPGALIGLIGIFMAFGHSFLAMSGEESLAQVNRELEYPKHQNLVRAGIVIFIFSIIFTSTVSFFAYSIIPDEIRPQYFGNLISGIAIYLNGPESLKLIFQAFIVIVGFLMLSGAINTSIIGANGVLNRVSEDGVLAPWFRAPHKKFGTSYRIINLIFILQLLAIIGSRGETYVLGEAYAFGVIWSFSFNALSMMVLRFQKKERREWKVPINLRIGRFELPIGLGTVMTILFFVAGINLITKQVATVSGILFTAVFFVLFLVSERVTERRRIAEGGDNTGLDQFRLQPQEEVSTATVEVRPGNTICLVRDYNTLGHVSKALQLTHTGKTDLVVMTVQLLKGPHTGYEDIAENQLFTSYEQMLFSRIVSLAEKAGKHIDLLVVPSSDLFQAVALTAAQLDSARIIAGRSSVITAAEQAKRMGVAWEKLAYKPKHQVTFLVVEPDGRFTEYSLGAHAPRLSDEDINLIHNLWLELVKEHGTEDLHHREVVQICLTRLQKELKGDDRKAIFQEFHDLKNKLRKEEKSH